MWTGVFSEQSIFQPEKVFMQDLEDEKEMHMIFENPQKLWHKVSCGSTQTEPD